MASLAQNLAVVPSVAKSPGLQAMRTLGLVKAARMELTIDERAMPRATDAPGREVVVHVGARPLRKRQTSWKQLLGRGGDTV